MRKQIGCVLIVAAILCFSVNFGLVNALNLPSVFSSIFSLQWLWNPLSFVAPMIAGTIPFIGGAFTGAVIYILALIWSFGLGITGIILVK